MRKLFLKIHRYLAIPFGIFISIACFTGALLVFRNELVSLFGGDDVAGPFFKGVLKLHRWLFMPPENPHGGMSAGRLIVGISTICLSFVLLTGLYLWWPRNISQLKKRLSVSFAHGWKRFVRDSHVSLGIYSLVFLLLMSLTGPVWSFKWYRTGAAAALGLKDAPRGGKENGEKGRKGENAGKNIATFNDANGIKKTKKATAKEDSRKLAGKEKQKGKKPAQKVFISLHTGKWGGLTTRIIYAISAIIGGFLPISGYYLWWCKRRVKNKA